jgi:hypothetical protein
MRTLEIQTFREAEVKCLHCGSAVGLLSQRHGQPGAPTTFRSTPEAEPRPIRSLREVRCDRCTGPVYTDEYELRYVYPVLDEIDKPRRGRPPKWLVELRRAREAELEESA